MMKHMSFSARLWRGRWLGVILCAFFLQIPVLHGFGAEASAESIEQLRRENQSLRAEVEKLRAENRKLRTRLIEGPSKDTPQKTASEEDKKVSYRLSKSGIRHNASCRYFKASGRPCRKNEGKPCKKCGG